MRNFFRRLSAIAAVFGVVAGMTGCGGTGNIAKDSGLTVHYIDVGQADAILVECDGEAMMIDGGNVEDSSLVVSYLKSHNIESLKYVIGTHAHEDHIGGLAGVLSKFEAERVLCSQDSYTSKAFGNFKKYAEAQGKKIEIPKAGDILSLGGSEIEIVGPVSGSKDLNNLSIVMQLTYGDTNFLFQGDAERDEETDIIGNFDVTADVLKVGHHGSETSSSYVYLRETMPEYVVISVGAGNSYGHPHAETVSRLNDLGAKLYRTDENGTITAYSDGKNITFETEK